MQRQNESEFKPCPWHVRHYIPMFCSTDCKHWQKQVDVITAMEVDALVNPTPRSEE